MKLPLCLTIACVLCLPVLAAPSKKPMPRDGDVFHFEPNSFKYINCDAEFRDPKDQKWPNFFYGRPGGGTHKFDDTTPTAQLSVVFDKMCQPKGDQSRRVLGDLSKPDAPPPVTFTITSMSPFRTETIESSGRKGPEKKEVELSELNATLQVGGRKVNVKPKATFSYHADKNGTINRCTIEARFVVKAGDLGLTSMPPTSEVQVRMTINGSPNQAAPPKNKR